MSFLGGLIDRLKGEQAVDYVHYYLDDSMAPQHAVADKQYIRVWLRSARIADVRRWSAKFHAVVHSQFTYTDRAQGKQEVIGVVAPGKTFETMDPVHLDRFIVVNRPLLGPIPYRGEMTMDVALFSVSAADLAKPYLDLLAELTNNASVGFLGQIKPFVEPLRRGAESLFSQGNQAQLEIGLSRTDTKLQAGNIVIARAEKGVVNREDLRIDAHDFRLIDATGKPVTDFPYIILGIEVINQRDDYAAIPEIRAGWKSVCEAASEGRAVDEIRARFDHLRRAIWLSPDLIQPDKKRIVDVFNQEISDAGYDVAQPLENVSFEALSRSRPLREVDLVLEGLQRLLQLSPAEGVLETMAVPSRISLGQLQEMMTDLDVPETLLRQYFVGNPDTSRPFAPSLIPDPARVEVAAPSDILEGAMMMDWANGLCRLRRQKEFNRRANRGDQRLILVSEGDSWFQFPLFLEDVIDQVFEEFNIWSVDAAGDTLENMVLKDAEYMKALRQHKGVQAFLFSGAGNDIVGEDASGRAIIPQIVKRFEPGRAAEWYVDTEAFAAKMRFIEDCYRKVISNVTAEFPDLPIICHGYDYAIPGGTPGDTRNPLWASQDKWIGRPLREDLGILDHRLQYDIVRLLIDRLNERLKSLCGGNNPNGAFRNVWHVDVRGTVEEHWADELHPTDEGFRLVAARFRSVLGSALRLPELLLPNFEDAILVTPNVGDDSEVDAAELAPAWDEAFLEAIRSWRVADSLRHLKKQVDTRAPSRRRDSDGTIGDAAHASRNSDHNPWVIENGTGVVTALDITHDPLGGCDAGTLAESIRTSRDPRVKYIIWNRQIASSSSVSGAPAWAWRPYLGNNPHNKHVHISVKSNKDVYDSTADWLV
jgi:hypothetical protein